jgi:2-keto-4-pentenoate hydratase
VDVVAQAEAADLLLSAYETRGPIEPLVEKWDGLTIDDAYEIQLLQIRRRLSVGARIKGHKVGLASAVMQRQMGVNQPDFGHLLDDMFWLEHMPIPVSRFLQPRVEPEVAFVLKRPLRGPGVTVAEAVAAVDFLLPGSVTSSIPVSGGDSVTATFAGLGSVTARFTQEDA